MKSCGAFDQRQTKRKNLNDIRNSYIQNQKGIR